MVSRSGDETSRKVSKCLEGFWDLSACSKLLFLLSPFVIALYLAIDGDIRAHLTYVPKFGDQEIYSADGRKIIRIAYFGDSLIGFSDRDYGFVQKEVDYLGKKWPGFAFDAISTGVSGDKAHTLLARVYKDVITHHPDCIILYFDSDASDIKREIVLSTDYEITYKDNLRKLLVILLTQAPRCVALAGPTTFGEWPRGSGLNPRDDIYDAYADINKQVVAEFGGNVTLFPTRDIFFEEAKRRGCYFVGRGCLTWDGEHHNGPGVSVISSIFTNWLVAKLAERIGPPQEPQTL